MGRHIPSHPNHQQQFHSFLYQAKAAQKEYRQKYVAAYPQKRVKRLETLFVYKSFSRDNNKQVTGKGEKKHVK